jgi:uncharacterized SAM-dependent methyltransferase
MVAEVRAGLHAVQKKLPSKYLYDERGSALLEEIQARPGAIGGFHSAAVRKEHSRLVAACNDAAGLTAEFNRNRR